MTAQKDLPQDAVDIFATFATDPKLEVGGVSTTLPGCGPVKFLIARAENARFKRLADEQFKKYRTVLEKMDDAASIRDNEIMADIYSQSILVGWDRPVLFKGAMVDYSPKVAAAMLVHKEFRKLVTAVANDFSNYKFEQDAADLGN
jgi:hypothetical protein